MPRAPAIGSALGWRLRAVAMDAQVGLRTRHRAGPRRVRLAPDGVAVVLLMRDAAYWLETFLARHRALGAQHFLLIDNGSTDATLSIARAAAAQGDVTLVSNPLPARRYETRLRARIARRVLRGGWLLFLDADEIFEPPQGAAPGALAALVGYCNAHGFSAVVAQVLDMVSPLPLSATRAMPYAEAVERFDRYSLAGLERFGYFDPGVRFAWYLRGNRCDFAAVEMLFGGLRAELFGERPCLSTHRLVRNGGGARPYTHPHAAGRVAVADVTALIRHYKFCGDFLGREAAQVAAGTWNHGEDARRLAALQGREDRILAGRAMQRWAGTGPLFDAGFLVAAPRARAALGLPLDGPDRCPASLS